MLLITILLVGGAWKVESNLIFDPDGITKESILKKYDKLNDEVIVSNENPKLAYVTPWNKHGFELAVRTASKLTHISPVWFQAKPRYKKEKLYSCEIEGSHDIDREWIRQMRSSNEKIKIMPRLIFDRWDNEEMEHFLINTQTNMRCAKKISSFFKKNEFDGAVIELWMQALSTTNSLSMKPFLVEALEAISAFLKKKELGVILTVPAPLDWKKTPHNLINPSEYSRLTDAADYVQIMTYDYIGNKPAGVAPFDWVNECISYLVRSENSHKTLVGLNWYGYEFKNSRIEPILASRFIKVLRDEKSIYEFDEKSMEHALSLSSSIIYYPSLTSLELRIKLAHSYSAGIAIWDYGQGLDYFTNLLN